MTASRAALSSIDSTELKYVAPDAWLVTKRCTSGPGSAMATTRAFALFWSASRCASLTMRPQPAKPTFSGGRGREEIGWWLWSRSFQKSLDLYHRWGRNIAVRFP